MDPIVAAGAAPVRRSSSELRDAASPLQPAAGSSGDRIERNHPSAAVPSDIVAMPLSEKIQQTSLDAVSIAAEHATGRLGKLLSDPKVNIGIVAGGVALAAIQAVPVLDVTVDATLGLSGILAYGAAGAEHRAAMSAAADGLWTYVSDVNAARTRPQLDAASHELAHALERGGSEAVNFLTMASGMGSGAFKLGGAAEKLINGIDLASRSPRLVSVTAGAYASASVHGEALLERSSSSALGAEITALQKRRMKSMQASAPAERRPRMNLETHEAAGGHTIARHVGKSDGWLRQRVAQEGLEEASTFTTRDVADRCIRSFVTANQSAIDRWLSDTKGKPDFAATHSPGFVVGRVVRADRHPAVDTSTAKIVLMRDSSRQGYHVLTAFPVEKLQ